jgi:hypothetical protein
MSDLRAEIFEAANVESDKIVDWLTERDVPFEVAALALLIKGGRDDRPRLRGLARLRAQARRPAEHLYLRR